VPDGGLGLVVIISILIAAVEIDDDDGRFKQRGFSGAERTIAFLSLDALHRQPNEAV
jgi:hypothetical protein